jgi:hypothetical protein
MEAGFGLPESGHGARFLSIRLFRLSPMKDRAYDFSTQPEGMKGLGIKK